jgi:nitrate reductase cytochrome c-type subunit
MYNIIQTIKGSRAIVILLILYSCITIAVVALDRSYSNKEKDKTTQKDSNNNANKQDTKDTSLTEFIDNVNLVYEDVDDYVVRNNILTNMCLPLSTVYGNNQEGSVLIANNGETYHLWYSNGKYAVNGVIITGEKLKESEISTQYSTPYYNNCAINE